MSHSISLPSRIINATPILGPLSRAIAKDNDLIFYVLVILVTAMVLAIKTFGLAALVVTYLALVPMMFIFFVAISWP